MCSSVYKLYVADVVDTDNTSPLLVTPLEKEELNEDAVSPPIHHRCHSLDACVRQCASSGCKMIGASIGRMCTDKKKPLLLSPKGRRSSPYTTIVLPGQIVPPTIVLPPLYCQGRSHLPPVPPRLRHSTVDTKRNLSCLVYCPVLPTGLPEILGNNTPKR